MPYKVVTALREDFLADLEGWRPTIPSLRRNRMRLLPMGPEQALQAVCNERTNHLVAEPLAREIVAFLATGGRHPRRRRIAGRAAGRPWSRPCSASSVVASTNTASRRARPASTRPWSRGAREPSSLDFYRTSLHDQPERVRRFVEEELITEHGFRNSYSVDDALAHGFVTAKELRGPHQLPPPPPRAPPRHGAHRVDARPPDQGGDRRARRAASRRAQRARAPTAAPVVGGSPAFLPSSVLVFAVDGL